MLYMSSAIVVAVPVGTLAVAPLVAHGTTQSVISTVTTMTVPVPVTARTLVPFTYSTIAF